MKHPRKRRPSGASRHPALLTDMKKDLARALLVRRIARKMTQVRLAKRLGSSQARVSKIESGDRTVSLDLLVRALSAAGATRRDIAVALG